MNLRLRLSLLLILLFATAIGNTLFIFTMERYGDERLEWVVHTHKVMNKSEQLLSFLTDTETGQRGYLLTGDKAYLTPYHDGRYAATKIIEGLFESTIDNPKQQERLRLVEKLITDKFAELLITIELRQKNEQKLTDQALQIVKDNEGKYLMDTIRYEMAVFVNKERILLEQRNSEFVQGKTFISTVLAAELIFFLFLGLVTANFIRSKLFVPMQVLLDGTSKMEAGEKQHIADLLPQDEMGYLLSRFYTMNEVVHANTAELTYEATHDALTGLENRSGMDDKIKQTIHRLDNDAQKMAVLFIDLDGFKQLNDEYGHDIGDEILVETARRLKESLRSDDLVFRLGGDEFVIVLANIGHIAHAKRVVTNILEQFKLPYNAQGVPITISLSIGVSIAPEHSTDSEDILKFADIAMYAAKQDKGVSFKFFNTLMLKRENGVVDISSDYGKSNAG